MMHRKELETFIDLLDYQGSVITFFENSFTYDFLTVYFIKKF